MPFPSPLARLSDLQIIQSVNIYPLGAGWSIQDDTSGAGVAGVVLSGVPNEGSPFYTIEMGSLQCDASVLLDDNLPIVDLTDTGLDALDSPSVAGALGEVEIHDSDDTLKATILFALIYFPAEPPDGPAGLFYVPQYGFTADDPAVTTDVASMISDGDQAKNLTVPPCQIRYLPVPT